MKNIKKLLLLTLCFSIIAFAVSCNKKEDVKETNNAQVEDTTSKETENTSGGEILVGAAASLTDAMNEIKPIFEEKENCTLNFTYAASGTLQKQIEEDGGIDVFISASESKMNQVLEKDLMVKDSIFPLLKNKLVLIKNKEANVDINMENFVENSNKIAIGQPDVVPAGQYAKQSLENLSLWESGQEKFVFAKDVRAVLAYVSTGECESGFVYKSDAVIDDNVEIAEEVKDDVHDKIVYPAGIVKSTKNQELAQKFLDFLKESEAKDILTKYGFELNE